MIACIDRFPDTAVGYRSAATDYHNVMLMRLNIISKKKMALPAMDHTDSTHLLFFLPFKWCCNWPVLEMQRRPDDGMNAYCCAERLLALQET
jgi:hypothetical protein